jgi:hypothetical protein
MKNEGIVLRGGPAHSRMTALDFEGKKEANPCY